MLTDSMIAVPCDPFFLHWFGECLRSTRDYVGFCVAMSSICFWIVAQFPQYYKNYQTKTVEALSPWFLAQWLLGDTGNIMGCLLTGDQQSTTTYTAMYFVVADIVLMTQYVYYGTLARRKERIYSYMKRKHRHLHDGGDVLVHNNRPATHNNNLRTTGVLLGVSSALGAAEAANIMGVMDARVVQLTAHHRPPWMRTAGQACGYVSSALYLSSRIPQIWKNHQRRSVEGLALAMFFCAVCANLAYGAGILIRAEDWMAIVHQAPWIIGSLGTVTLDTIILCQKHIPSPQFVWFRGAKPRPHTPEDDQVGVDVGEADHLLHHHHRHQHLLHRGS